MISKKIKIYDSTLRDGNHAYKHQINAEQIKNYSTVAENAGITYVEVGHGNGLGASSLQVGYSKITNQEMLNEARKHLNKSLLSTFLLPGWGTMKDIAMAIDTGVDVIRVGTHCTEADLTEKYIRFLSKQKIEVHGTLIMSHMATPEILAEQAGLIESYGAHAIGIFDSSGYYLPEDVKLRIKAILSKISIPVIFHGHNNLGMAVANSIMAVETGATIIDACIRGFGAGAGNAQLEVLIGVLARMKYETGVDLNKILDAADLAEEKLNFHAPTISTISIVSGIAGVFSGFKPQVMKIAKDYQLSPRDIFYELGRRQAIAGQEDQIIEVAQSLKKALTLKE